MPGLRINYHKSEVFTIGICEEHAIEIAYAVNCKLTKFPMKYLGIPISDRKLSKLELREPEKKLENRLDTWKCGQLSSGGKSILINSSLSSIPMYCLGFYRMYEVNHKKFDSIRERFFWEGVGNKKKYHMVCWDALARPNEYGGL